MPTRCDLILAPFCRRQVKLHAYEYFVRLTRHCKSDPPTHCKWSAQEDFTFEQGLAEFPEGEEDWLRLH